MSKLPTEGAKKNARELAVLQCCDWLDSAWLGKPVFTNATNVQPNSIFIAVKIKDHHGEADIAQALQRGADIVLCEESATTQTFAANRKVAFVPSARVALFRIAQAKRALLRDVIAITGSYGKTSLKDFLQSLLAHEAFSTPNNQNTKIGIAQTILDHTANKISEAEIAKHTAIIEAGARAAFDLAIPKAICQPSIAVCLPLGDAHLGIFGSKTLQAQTKYSLLAQEENPHLRTAVYFKDQEDLLKKTFAATNTSLPRQTYSFGYQPAADVYINTQAAALYLPKLGNRCFPLPQNSAHRGVAENLAAALCIVLALERHDLLETFAKHCGAFRFTSGRYHVEQRKGRLFIDDSFNASPETVLAGLHALLADYPNKEKLIVLGDMLELGEHSHQAHVEIVRFTQQQKMKSRFIFIGEAYRKALQAENAFHTSNWFASTDKAINAIQAGPLPGAEALASAKNLPDTKEAQATEEVVYAKASRAIGLSKLMHSL